MSDNYLSLPGEMHSFLYPTQPEETSNDKTQTSSIVPSVGSNSSKKLSTGLANSAMLSSKSINSKLTPSFESKLNSIIEINRRSASLNTQSDLPTPTLSTPRLSTPSVSTTRGSTLSLPKRSGLLSTISTSVKKVAGPFRFTKRKSSSKVDVSKSSTSLNTLTGSVKSMELSSNNNEYKMPPGSSRNPKKVKLDGKGRPISVASSSTKLSRPNDSKNSKLSNKLAKSFKSLTLKSNMKDRQSTCSSRNDKRSTSSGRKLKKIQLDKNGIPMNKSFDRSTSLRQSNSARNNSLNRTNSRRNQNVSNSGDMFDNFITTLRNSNMIVIDNHGKSDGKLFYVEGNKSNRNKATVKVGTYEIVDELGKAGKNYSGSQLLPNTLNIRTEDECIEL